MTNKIMKKIFIDDNERKALDKSYCVLIEDSYSVERKLTAVELLSKFIHLAEHRSRIEILYQREKNTRVKKHLKKALNGSLFSDVEEIFKTINKLDEEIESEYLNELKLADRMSINSNLPFYRYQAKFSSN